MSISDIHHFINGQAAAGGIGPSTALLMGKMLKQAGLPDGVFNLVQGDNEAVDALIGVACGSTGER